MKTIRKITFLIAALMIVVISSFAVDRVVEEGGTYTSIQMAVDSSADGDRIIIKSRAGGLPWIEDVSIAKSLEFLSFDNDTFFVVQGNFTITPAVGRTVNIIGMKNNVGDISGTTTSPTGVRTTVNIMNCYLLSGNVLFDYDNWDVNVVSSEFDDGYIQIRHGDVIGNDMGYPTSGTANIYIKSEASPVNDTLWIVANKVYNTSTSRQGIYWNCNSSYFRIMNNWIRHVDYGIRVSTTINGSTTINKIYNNSIATSTSTSTTIYGMYLSGSPASSIVEVMNNGIDESISGSTYGILLSANSGTMNLYYNHIDVSHSIEISGTPTFSSDNNTSSSFSFLSTGVPSGGSLVNGANPDVKYYDLDLTVGDIGCYGGSSTLDNFYPLFNGSARVYFMRYQQSIRQGNTLSIEADSYDR